ncbi:polypeptide N-acetylgalactosaminyltransferase 11-like [Ruditapes philippinarum]|uniref:polypeptide N-acetylgalactosaminyltransferase 11-like n=1 Tax=Ruditapes philippinarum TaxID=129788 RepID=UPI00295A5CFB|nr:polypeptide N-acetylgalactosaminyltransferase 11-like [Ruditapes philippinarum]
MKPNTALNYKTHGINVGLSDLVALNRQVPDSRPYGCSDIEYPSDLPTVGIVIPFHNEWPSLLLRTIFSIINRTPKHLLKEIVLIDDCSNLPSLQAHFQGLLEKYFPKNLIKLKRLRSRSGLIVARMEGLKLVTADCVSFFDSHMEVNENWLPPLLTEIKKNPKTVAMTQLDYINKDSLSYDFDVGYRTRYGFDWRLLFFETFFRADTLDGKTDTDPVPGVVMVGPGAVVNVQYFKELGGFDTGMKIWGGENLEFPWRVWLCGGQMIHVPCSRTGHIARSQPYHFPNGRQDTENHNYKRAIEVWMDDYKEYVYEANPLIRSVDAGDLTERLELKNRLQCKPFKWFLDNIWPELNAYKENNQAWGFVQNSATGSNMCLDNDDYLFSIPNPVKVKPCSENVIYQMFSLTAENLFRSLLQCVIVKGTFLSDKQPKLQGCFEGPHETWTHSGPGLLKHDNSELCLELTRSLYLVMNLCDEKSPWQKWTFTHYSPAHNKRIIV